MSSWFCFSGFSLLFFFSFRFPLTLLSLSSPRRRHPRAREISLWIARRVRDESISISQVRPRERERAQERAAGRVPRAALGEEERGI